MSWDSRDEVRSAVFGEIEGRAFAEAFERLKEHAVALSSFASAPELIAFLRVDEPAHFTTNDAALHALLIVAGRADDEGRAAQTLLMAAMWPGIVRSYVRVRCLIPTELDPFAEVYWAFIEEVRQWNAEKRDRVAANLRMNTEKRVRAMVAAEARRKTAHEESVVADLRGYAVGAPAADASSEPDRRLGLDDLVAACVISHAERDLIHAHVVQGQPLKQIAAEMGTPRKTVSRRYERALANAALFISRENQHSYEDFVSPRSRKPASPVGRIK